MPREKTTLSDITKRARNLDRRKKAEAARRKKDEAAGAPVSLTPDEADAFARAAAEIAATAAANASAVPADKAATAAGDMMRLLAACRHEMALRDGYIAAMRGEPVPVTSPMIYTWSPSGELCAVSASDLVGKLKARGDAWLAKHFSEPSRGDASWRTVWRLYDEVGPGA